ncbi:MAG: hypothetical protein V7K64_01920 [Nostoc sp.]|uniref:hypothetical protein n=1 Tax=Nostoc sp. TaxID=1180 RepID=UPI002FF92C0E
MKDHKYLVSFAVASLVGITFAISTSKTLAQQTLQPSQTVSGIISEATSHLFVFNGKQYLGEEYNFEGRAGEKIRIAVEKEVGSNLLPIIVLIKPSGSVGVINNNEMELDLTGTWKVRVLSSQTTQGRYQVSLVKRVDQGQVLNEFLRTQQEAEARRIREAQEAEARRIREAQEAARVKRQEENLIPPSWGLTRVTCSGAGLVEIFINSKQACAIPTANLPAGRYGYDPVKDELVPLSVPNTVNPNPSNQEGSGF